MAKLQRNWNPSLEHKQTQSLASLLMRIYDRTRKQQIAHTYLTYSPKHNIVLSAY